MVVSSKQVKLLAVIFFLFIVSCFIVTSAQAQTTSLQTFQVDFSNQVATGSPLIFGGTQTPQWQPINQKAWDKLQEVGVTFIRQDIAFETFVPNSSVEAYKQNQNNIQDPNTWHQGGREYIINKFLDAQKRGMKTMAIVSYAPGWLTHNGQENGLPKDWDVWEDMVKKTILNFKNDYGVKIDYYEVWNEPGDEWMDQFFSIVGTGMTKQEAYDQLYFHTWKAIKEVDPQAKIGGPADYQPDSAVKNTRYMLNDTLVKDKLDFISYHYYHKKHQYIVENFGFFNLGRGAASNLPLKNLLQQMGRSEIPIILSEYNYACCGSPGTGNTRESVTYIGKNFIDLLKQGVIGANYFTTSGDLCTLAQTYLCFYRIVNDQIVLQPEAYVFRLVSQQLGLGKGSSRVFATTSLPDTNLNATGALNSEGQPVLLFSNSGSETQTITANIVQSNLSGTYRASIYLANLTSDPVSPYKSIDVTFNNGSASLSLEVPGWSVMGVKVEAKVADNPPSPTPAATPPVGNDVPGDSNNDGVADGRDYTIMIKNFGRTTTGGSAAGDFNGDGKVTTDDYRIWRRSFTL